MEEMIDKFKKGCYVGDIDLSPNIDDNRQLSKEDLEQTTFEVNDIVYDEFGEPVSTGDITHTNIEEGD